jgi:Fe-S cluster assembly protein SufD
MTIQPQISLTPAETALLDAFGGAIGQLPGDAAVTTQRSTLIQGIKANGLPTRRIENWHYTDLRLLLRTIPTSTSATVVAEKPLVAGSSVLALSTASPMAVPRLMAQASRATRKR